MNITAAVVLEKEQPFGIEEVELDEPGVGEVLVRIVGSGVCHTDLIVGDQWYPVALPAGLGHEGSGIVERIGEGNKAGEESESGEVLKPILRMG